MQRGPQGAGSFCRSPFPEWLAPGPSHMRGKHRGWVGGVWAGALFTQLLQLSEGTRPGPRGCAHPWARGWPWKSRRKGGDRKWYTWGLEAHQERKTNFQQACLSMLPATTPNSHPPLGSGKYASLNSPRAPALSALPGRAESWNWAVLVTQADNNEVSRHCGLT